MRETFNDLLVNPRDHIVLIATSTVLLLAVLFFAREIFGMISRTFRRRRDE